MIPTAKYASTLASSISDSAGSITITSASFINGKSSGGAAVPAAPLAIGDHVRVLKPLGIDPCVTGSSASIVAEIMEITAAPVTNPDGSLTLTVDRSDDAGLAGRPYGCLLYTSPSPRD